MTEQRTIADVTMSSMRAKHHTHIHTHGRSEAVLVDHVFDSQNRPNTQRKKVALKAA